MAVVILLLLTFVAGGTDATTFLFIGGAFVSNQTGTVLLLAMNAGGANVVDTTSAVVSIVAFIFGATWGGRSLPRLGPGERWPARTAVVLWSEVMVMVTCLVISWLTQAPAAWIVGLLALMMGQQAAVATRVAMPYLTTGFITGVLAKSAMESPAGDRSQRRWWYAATPVATIASGALLVGVVAAKSVPAAFGVLAAVVALAAWLSQSASRLQSAGDDGR